MEKGTRVLVRTQSAGVHYGTLVSRQGQETILTDARRIWSWTGALSLSEIASKGVNVSGSKISVPVEEIILPTSIEIIKVSEQCNLPR